MHVAPVTSGHTSSATAAPEDDDDVGDSVSEASNSHHNSNSNNTASSSTSTSNTITINGQQQQQPVGGASSSSTIMTNLPQLMHWSEVMYECTDVLVEEWTIAGGSDYGQMCYFLDTGDILLEMDGIQLSGLTRADVLQIVSSNELHNMKAVSSSSSFGLPVDLKEYLSRRFVRGCMDHELQAIIRDNVYMRTIPCTTRPPRPGELDNIDYKFVTRDEFLVMEKSGVLLESGIFSGHYYGTPLPISSPGTPTLTPGEPMSARAYQRNHSGSGSNVTVITNNNSNMQDQKSPAAASNTTTTSNSTSLAAKRKRNRSNIAAIDASSLPHGWEKISDTHYGVYYIDHINKRTQYERPYELELTKGCNGFGFTLIELDRGLIVVKNVIPGGPAYSSGVIQPGDVLVSLSGVSVSGLEHSDIARLFSTFSVGDRVKLTFARGYQLPPEVLMQEQDYDYMTITLEKGANGFGFTIADSNAGQKVKKILDQDRCGNLRQGDILCTVNNNDLTIMRHNQVVDVLKNCNIGDQASITIKRKKRFRSRTPVLFNQQQGQVMSSNNMPSRNCKTPSCEMMMRRNDTDWLANDDGGNNAATSQLVNGKQDTDAGDANSHNNNNDGDSNVVSEPSDHVPQQENDNLDENLNPNSESGADGGQHQQQQQQHPLASLVPSSKSAPQLLMPAASETDHRHHLHRAGYNNNNNLQQHLISTPEPPPPIPPTLQHHHLQQQVLPPLIPPIIGPPGPSMQQQQQIATTPVNYNYFEPISSPEEEEYEYYRTELKRSESGFGFRIIGGAEEGRPVSVGSLVIGGVAHRDEILKSGDEIISINERDVTGATHQYVVQLMSQCGDTVSLLVRRRKDSESFEVLLHRDDNEGFGFVLISCGMMCLIGRIIDNSPTARNGRIHVRDKIIAVNDMDITGWPHSDIVNMIKESGRSLKLKIIPADCYVVELSRGPRGFGFSIRGGAEFNGMPLFILKIAPDGPAYTSINVGDEIVEINNISTVGMTHTDAVHIISRSGMQVKLKLRKNSAGGSGGGGGQNVNGNSNNSSSNSPAITGHNNVNNHNMNNNMNSMQHTYGNIEHINGNVHPHHASHLPTSSYSMSSFHHQMNHSNNNNHHQFILPNGHLNHYPYSAPSLNPPPPVHHAYDTGGGSGSSGGGVTRNHVSFCP